MKISQMIDKEIDQNEIESKYLWYNTSKEVKRINLSSLTVDFHSKSKDDVSITHKMAIPNNKIYVIMNQTYGSNFQSRYIIDEHFNKKIIEKPQKINKYHCFTSCYYDESIFTFESDIYVKKSISNLSKRYLISQDKWILLCPQPFKFPISCIGFNQKILIAEEKSGIYEIWIYDIILNSYTYCIPASNLGKKYFKIFIKSEGKIYLIILSFEFYEIYATDDPLSEWNFVFCFQECLVDLFLGNKVLYGGSIYYFREGFLHEFKIRNFKSRPVGDLRETGVNEKIDKIIF